MCIFFFFQAEDGIRDLVRSRGLGDVYKRQGHAMSTIISQSLLEIVASGLTWSKINNGSNVYAGKPAPKLCSGSSLTDVPWAPFINGTTGAGACHLVRSGSACAAVPDATTRRLCACRANVETVCGNHKDFRTCSCGWTACATSCWDCKSITAAIELKIRDSAFQNYAQSVRLRLCSGDAWYTFRGVRGGTHTASGNL
eukprot:TRINITY_DN7170_c0_g1_i1.p1 TRINITY_DN7170_c0_g1~~TRINITY_DN7170_c0_g1_i1.p1  ORF type:complete len:198 (-),score=39.70 TRINITY_DN7170_c0_g1_i1:23-616(-)